MSHILQEKKSYEAFALFTKQYMALACVEEGHLLPIKFTPASHLGSRDGLLTLFKFIPENMTKQSWLLYGKTKDGRRYEATFSWEENPHHGKGTITVYK